MRIADREIGSDQPPYVICEISGNHLGSLDRAFKLIDAAKEAGADACKFQAYEADTITIDHDGPGFILEDGPWKGKKLYDLYKEAETPFHWFKELFNYAKKKEITAFASVFDLSSVDLLKTLGCPCYKIASFEIIDIPLIQYAAKTGKPLIISTGMATAEEINDAYDASYDKNRSTFAALLSCVSSYPTEIHDANLSDIKWLRNEYPTAIGISDHTLGIEVPIAATALGATIIEKHLCLSRADGGPDAAFSLEPNEFKAMVEATRLVWAAQQPSNASSEAPQRQARRSLYIVQDVKAGDALTTENVRSIRPAYGLAPKMLLEVLGRKVKHDVAKGTPLSLGILE